jgi:16S rRNA (cytosine1402-N4)-methyltransferase
MHTPVLKDEVVQFFHITHSSKIIDATFGEGGHSLALIEAGASVLGLDADERQIVRFRTKYWRGVSGLTLVHANFAEIEHVARLHSFSPCDGVLFDLGISMQQFCEPYGLSFMQLHQPLDMVYDTHLKQQEGAARAADVIAEYPVPDLIKMFERNAEISQAREVALAIARARTRQTISHVADLVRVLKDAKLGRHVAQVFQALRIEVNQEYARLKDGLAGCERVVKPGATIQIISFHSLEDRIVKQFARKHNWKKVAKVLGRGSDKHFERSAVLRVYTV